MHISLPCWEGCHAMCPAAALRAPDPRCDALQEQSGGSFLLFSPLSGACLLARVHNHPTGKSTNVPCMSWDRHSLLTHFLSPPQATQALKGLRAAAGRSLEQLPHSFSGLETMAAGGSGQGVLGRTGRIPFKVATLLHVWGWACCTRETGFNIVLLGTARWSCRHAQSHA